MATPYALRSFAGGGQVTTLANTMQITDTSFSLTTASGWSNLGGANGNFWVEIDPGLPTDEKILCSALSGLVVTCVGRGGGSGDGSGAAQHQAGAVVRLVHVSQDDSEANALVANLGNVAKGAILLGGGAATLPGSLAALAEGSLLYGKGAGNNPAALAVGASGTFLGSNGTDPAWNATVLQGIATSALLASATATTDAFTATSCAVTVTTGTKAMVVVTYAALSNNSSNDSAYIGVAVSNASTIAASKSFWDSAPNPEVHAGSLVLVYGGGGGGPGALTAGSNTFTVGLGVQGGGTGTLTNCTITVIPLN